MFTDVTVKLWLMEDFGDQSKGLTSNLRTLLGGLHLMKWYLFSISVRRVLVHLFHGITDATQLLAYTY